VTKMDNAIFYNFGERRPEQADYGTRVDRFLRSPSSRICCLEAGTGIGKTFGYLLPAALFAIENGCKVTVSTNTLTLIRQVLDKDAGLIVQKVKEITGRNVVFASRFGMSNFVSASRISELVGRLKKSRRAPVGGSTNEEDMDYLTRLHAFAIGPKSTQIIQDWIDIEGPLPFDVESDEICLLPSSIASEHQKYDAQKDAAEGADIILQPHALTLLQCLRGDPMQRVVIFDEADAVPSAASLFAPSTVDIQSIISLAERLQSEGNALKNAAVDLRDWSSSFRPAHDYILVRQMIDRRADLMDRAGRIASAAYAASKSVKNTADIKALTELGKDVRNFVNCKDNDFEAAAIEWRNFGLAPCLRIAQRTSGRVASRAWEECGAQKILFTSATLGHPGISGEASISHFKSSVGISPNERLDESGGKIEPEKFGQLNFCVAGPSAPLPLLGGGETNPDWVAYVGNLVASIRNGNDRILILTPSHASSETLSAVIPGALLHARGTRVESYLDIYRELPGSILITAFGWSGIDLPGLVDHLIISRLPILPTDDVEREFMAVAFAQAGKMHLDANAIQRSRNAEAALRRMKQGIGRAIRSSTDAATVWITDPRFPVPEHLARDRRLKLKQGRVMKRPFRSGFVAALGRLGPRRRSSPAPRRLDDRRPGVQNLCGHIPGGGSHFRRYRLWVQA
jgi:ATP-dependent DNA helicase DinG